MPEARAITPGLFVTGPDGPRLVAGRCDACARLHFPANATCPYCGAVACVDTTVGPDARLYLYTTVTSRPAGYRGPVPYGFGIVEVDGGLRIVTRLTQTDVSRLRPALPMRLVVEPLFTDDDGTPVLSYAFRPETA
jgi:uncharacterized OB-fold protein